MSSSNYNFDGDLSANNFTAATMTITDTGPDDQLTVNNVNASQYKTLGVTIGDGTVNAISINGNVIVAADSITTPKISIANGNGNYAKLPVVAIASITFTPVKGMLVVDSTSNKLKVYTGSAWETVTSA